MAKTNLFNDVDIIRFQTFEEYKNYRGNTFQTFETRKAYESDFSALEEINGPDFFTDEETTYSVNSSNLRESLIDTKTNLNTRLRACAYLYDYLSITKNKSSIKLYLTEQVTPLFKFLETNSVYDEIVGSEFLDPEAASGTIINGVRHEDLNKLSFADNYFDFVLCFEVLEHVPTYYESFQELHRVLNKGGYAIITAPFTANQNEHTIRAVVENGEIVHIMEPEYHGDPVNNDGVLCFHYFGWDILKELREVGFKSAQVYSMYSKKYMILGMEQLIIVAQK